MYDLVYLLKYHDYTAKDLLDTIRTYRFTYTDKQIIQLIESKEGDELDIEFEGIAEPKMDITSYKDLKKILLSFLITAA